MAVTSLWKHGGFFDRLLALLLLFAHAGPRLACLSAVTFGVNYGKVANNLPAPAEVVTLIHSISIAHVRLYDADPLVLRTFGNTGVSFLVGVPNEELQTLAASQANAALWINQNIVPFYPSTHVIGIIVGNEIFSSDPALLPLVLPAMRNVYAALTSLALQGKIMVSTTHSFGVLSSSYPPSSGAFDPALTSLYIVPLLQFLAQTGAPFMINAYPFFAYKADPVTVSLDYVLFKSGPGVVDSANGLHYTNMFDAQLDSVYSAMATLGYANLSLLVAETGWPSAGDANEVGASVQNAQAYNNNLYKHIVSTRGTPLRPNAGFDVYIFALFNENLKPGPTSERNYGLFHPDGSKVYDVDFTSSMSQILHPSVKKQKTLCNYCVEESFILMGCMEACFQGCFCCQCQLTIKTKGNWEALE